MNGLPSGRPAIMGILNVTPDSFSDGGLYLDPKAAIEHGLRMAEEGADWIDVGGESTRPGADEVPAGEELRRVLPVVERLARAGLRISIDTTKPEVAEQALAAGATAVNDVSGLRDPDMIELCSRTGCFVCIMHMQGTPRTMQAHPVYGDVVRDVAEYLYHAATLAEAAGVQRERIWLDPGIGFGKTTVHNLELLRRLDEIVRLGYPVLIGVSRKSFLGKIIGTEAVPAPPDDRLEATLAAQTLAQARGARILRTHDVAAARRASLAAQAILDGSRSAEAS